jgi:IS5 family transposase
MLKVMLLQQWYAASDPAIEEALRDRLSFRRFAGFGLDDATPDHSTISRFRTQLTRRGLAAPLFAAVGRQLEARGLLVKQGTLLDATLLEAQVRRPPFAAGPRARSSTDRDAAWARKGGAAHFGYKAHVGMDAGSGLIRRARLTPANVNETEVAEELLGGDEAAVYADKAYDTKARRARLKSRGVKDRIMHRPNKHHPELPHWQKRRNALLSRVRAPVEQVFGTLKRGYGYRRVRYLGLERNATELWLKCTAYNLKRAVRLLPA